MHDRLVDVLDQVEATLAVAREVTPEDALNDTAMAGIRIRNRLDYPLDMAVVALAGGTGSGKSSLFNAILGTETAEVGGLRPTTSRALASVPTGRGSKIRGHLSALGDLDTVSHREPAGLVLIDLPDTDSVEVDHRLLVDSLLPKVDAVVWVTDVEKYHDRALHGDYLKPLSRFASQFIFVLNQVDRLREAEVGTLMSDFAQALRDDGYDDPPIHAVAANPMLSSPIGVDQLTASLEGLADGLAIDRLLVELEGAVEDVESILGPGPDDFDGRWGRVLDEALDHVERSDVVAGSRVLSGFLNQVSEETSGVGSVEAMALAAHIGESLHEHKLVGEREVPPRMEGKGGWARNRNSRVDGASAERRQWMRSSMDSAVDPLRPLWRQRGVARAHLAGLAVSVAELRTTYGD